MMIKKFSLPFQSLKNLEDLDNLAEVIKLARIKDVYYRGQREDWTLLPGIAQLRDKLNLPKDETKMFDEFRQESQKYLDPIPNNQLDWLAIAQHHGLPTRLLDWTTDPYIGLWFAVRKSADEKNKPGVLWIFTPDPEDVFNKDISGRHPFSGSRTKIFVPTTPHLDGRIKAQNGAFTVHKYIEKENRFVPLEKNKRQKSKLYKMTIDSSDFSSLRGQLRDRKINDSVLFPGLDSLSHEIKMRYINLRDNN